MAINNSFEQLKNVRQRQLQEVTHVPLSSSSIFKIQRSVSKSDKIHSWMQSPAIPDWNFELMTTLRTLCTATLCTRYQPGKPILDSKTLVNLTFQNVHWNHPNASEMELSSLSCLSHMSRCTTHQCHACNNEAQRANICKRGTLYKRTGCYHLPQWYWTIFFILK